MKILLISSGGGHLAQLLALRGWWGEHDRAWVTFRKTDTVSALSGEQVFWIRFPMGSNTVRGLGNLSRGIWSSKKIIDEVRPDLIVSTGAACAISFFYWGYFKSIQTVFIEVIDRIDRPTLTGLAVYPVASLFCVQWERQKANYPKAVLVGELL